MSRGSPFHADDGAMMRAQGKNLDLQREVRWHEEQRLKEYERLEAVQLSRRRGTAASSAERRAAAMPQEDGAARVTLDRDQVLHAETWVAGGHRDAADDGSDIEEEEQEEEEDQELASYSSIHGLATQPWPSIEPVPSRQRRRWDEARNNIAARRDAAHACPSLRAPGAFAASEPVTGSRGSNGAAHRARASVSWDVPPHPSEATVDKDTCGELSVSWGQHDGYEHYHAEKLRASGCAWTAAPSNQRCGTSGPYCSGPHTSNSWEREPYEDLEPTRSVSPSQAPGHRPAVAKRGGPNTGHAGVLRSSVHHDDTANTDQRDESAETPLAGMPPRGSAQREKGDSLDFWQRFAADDLRGASEAVSDRCDRWGFGHQQEEHEHSEPGLPQRSASAHAHSESSSAAGRQKDGRGRGRPAGPKVRVVLCRLVHNIAWHGFFTCKTLHDPISALCIRLSQQPAVC